MQFTNKQSIAIFFIVLGLISLRSQPSEAYSIRDLQELQTTEKQAIAIQQSTTKRRRFPTNREIFNAYFNAGYGYCDAQMLGKFWNTDPASAKLLAGKGLLRLSGFPTNIPGKLRSARQRYSGQGVCDYSSDFSYDDAVALASYWKVPIATAKTSLTTKLEAGNLAIAKSEVRKARRAAKK
jgi:hypothetical protein